MMLANGDCLAIAQFVHRLRITHPRNILSATPRRATRSSLEAYFSDTLYPHLTDRFPHLHPVPLSIVGAMAYLAPGRWPEFPPTVLREDLIDQALSCATGSGSQPRLDRVVELGIAYGCGWGRRAVSGFRDWDAVWPGALQELVETAYNFSAQTIGILEDSVRGFVWVWVHKGDEGGMDQRETHRDRRKIDEINSDLGGHVVWAAQRFISPAPTDLQGPRYKVHQTIHSWHPTEGSTLYGWLQGAINGGPAERREDGGPYFKANAFRHGLIFPFFKENGLLDVGNIALQVCDRGHYEEAEYRGGTCSIGHKASYFKSKVVLIVPGVYVGMDFYLCNVTFNWATDPVCPHCRQGRPDRPALKWTCNHCKGQFYFRQEVCPVCKRQASQRPTVLDVLRPYVLGFRKDSW